MRRRIRDLAQCHVRWGAGFSAGGPGGWLEHQSQAGATHLAGGGAAAVSLRAYASDRGLPVANGNCSGRVSPPHLATHFQFDQTMDWRALKFLMT